jgi:hypothetical protein
LILEKEGMITIFSKKHQLLGEIYLARKQFQSPELEREVNESIQN